VEGVEGAPGDQNFPPTIPELHQERLYTRIKSQHASSARCDTSAGLAMQGSIDRP
jgi:hypothetical protein